MIIEKAFPVYINNRTGLQFSGFMQSPDETRAWCTAWLDELRHRKRSGTVRPVYLVRVRLK